MGFILNIIFWVIFLAVTLPILCYAFVPAALVLSAIVIGGVILGIIRWKLMNR